MKNTLISVIVPVYKVEPYLRECVDSILNQTFKDFELILVDDGSPDNCPQICDEYAKIDNRIVVIHKENGGLSSARNAGLDYVFANSNSKYISFVDSDDSVPSNLFETCLRLLTKFKGTESVKFSYSYSTTSSNKRSPSINCRYLLNENNVIDFLNHKLLTYDLCWEAWSWLFNADIIRKNKLKFFDNAVIFAEDILFSSEYSLCSTNIISTTCQLYNYVKREDSITGKNCDSKINEMNNLSYQLSLFIVNKNIKCDYYLIHQKIISNRLYTLPALINFKNSFVWKKIVNNIERKVFFKQNNREYFLTKIKNFKSKFDYEYVVYDYISTFNYFKLLLKITLFSIRNIVIKFMVMLKKCFKIR